MDKNITKNKFSKFYFPLFLVVLLACVPLMTKNVIFLGMMILIFWYAYMTSSWNIIGGFAGQLSYAHPAFAGIGAYTSTLLLIRWGLTPWVGMVMGGLFATLIAITIGYPCFKLRGAYFAIASIGFNEVLRITIQNVDEFFGFKIGGPMGILIPIRDSSLLFFQFAKKEYYYYVILAMMLVSIFIAYIVKKSKIGYCLVAIRDNIDAARSLGINVAKYRLIAIIVSTFLAALGGTFYAQYILFIDASPSGLMGLLLAFEIVFIAIIGGRGTLLGPIIGSFLLVPVSQLTRIYIGSTYSGLHLMVYGFLVMVIMLFLPGGISGPIQNFYFRFFGKLEKIIKRGE